MDAGGSYWSSTLPAPPHATIFWITVRFEPASGRTHRHSFTSAGDLEAELAYQPDED